MNLLALSIKLSRLLPLSRRPSSLLLCGLNFFLNVRADLLCCGCSRSGLFPIVLTHGRRFPLTDPLSHKLGTVGFAHVAAFDKQIDHRDIAPVVIQFKLPARQPTQEARTRVPAPLKREARSIMDLVVMAERFSVDRLHQKQLEIVRCAQILGDANFPDGFFPEHRTGLPT